MRAIVQRARSARVDVTGETVGRIDAGLVVFLGVGKGDTEARADALADKILKLRVFEDPHGKMSLALADVSGSLLVISQFTLYGDTSRGRRPSFDKAMPPEEAERLYERFVASARRAHAPVETGRFGAEMLVVIENDGPVTLILELPVPTAST